MVVANDHVFGIGPFSIEVMLRRDQIGAPAAFRQDTKQERSNGAEMSET